MLKNTVVKFVVGLAFVLALTTGGGIVADAFGFEVTSQAEAGNCDGGSGSSSGGGC
ncbi:MAG: hypothetical protein AAF485_00395 [Chloroflexota bacterium]